MDDLPLQVAVVGNGQSPELPLIRAGVKAVLPDAEVREFRFLKQFIESVQQRRVFSELVILSQSYRDEYSAAEVQHALAALPLARWVCVSGAWCESEGRHGSRWPMAVRVPLCSLESRLKLEAEIVKGRAPAVALTANRDELFTLGCPALPKPWAINLAVSVLSADRELRSWLEDICRQAGLQICEYPEDNTPQLLIVDVDPLTERTWSRLESLRMQHPDSKIVAVMGMVHPEDHSLLKSHGALGTLSKLALDVECLQVLARLAQGE